MKNITTSSQSYKTTTSHAILFYICALPLLQSSAFYTPATSPVNVFETPTTHFSPYRLCMNTSTSLFMAVPGGNEGVGGRKCRKRKFPVVPLIGPLINAPPLMVGSEMFLEPPTPLQWKTLEESVVVHRNDCAKAKEGEGTGHYLSKGSIATIEASPIVAVIDDATKISVVKSRYNNPCAKGRYATLAAVVGISPLSTSSNIDNNIDIGDDEASFMEYMNLSNQLDQKYLDSSVRLVGVGRAVIIDYFHRDPTLLSDGVDVKRDTNLQGKESFDDIVTAEDYEDGYSNDTPIIMAEFEPLVDDASIYGSHDPNNIGNKGAKSHRMSPVHAMAKLANLCHDVERMHASRQKLVSGLKAAKARLEIRAARNRGEFDDLEDHDGLGLLFADQLSNKEISMGDNKEEKEEPERMTIDEFLANFKGNMRRIDRSKTLQNQPAESEKVAKLENYGLNYYGAFSSISQLTRVAVSSMKPYYSKEFRDRDEYQFELASFVAWRALEGFASRRDIAWSLQSISSVERLQLGYDVMLHHRVQLEKLAEEISAELIECGEECTDLW